MKAIRFLIISIMVGVLFACAVVFWQPMLLFVWFISASIGVLVVANLVRFRYSNRGKVFLVYTRRHGWNEFVCNNLIPAVPNNVEPLEYQRGGRSPWPWLLRNIHEATYGRSKPFLAKVSWRGVHCVGLHELLLPLKPQGARRPEVQTKVRDMLASHLR